MPTLTHRFRACRIGGRLRLLAALGALALGGCAIAPGLYFAKAQLPGADGANPWSISTARTDTAAQDAPPADALILITPELVRQQRAARQNAEVPADVRALFGSPEDYKIGSGDLLNIVVWGHPEISMPAAAGGLGTDSNSFSGVGNGYNVSPRGLIQFPFIGNIKVSGLTEYEASDRIAQRLDKYLKKPQVSVRVQTYRSGRINIDGEVRTPGLLLLNDVPMTLPEAIGRSGGFTPAANRAAINVTRNGITAAVSLPQLAARGVNASSILLLNGDQIRINSRDDTKVFVMGEVLRPSSQVLRDGRLTLNEALGDAGGISGATGDPRQIYVVRSTGTGQPDRPQVFHLDARSPTTYALAEGFELQTRDVVYVDPVALVIWNRVINLILPSASAVVTGQAIAN